MKRIFLGAILSLFAMVQSFAREFNADDLYYAGDFSVGGIFYQITSDNTCMVVEPLEATELGVFGIADYISGDIVIPEIVSNNGDTYIVTNIGEGAFNDCFDLTSVVIPNSVINIGKQAFYGCIGLSSVVIPNSVTSIGDYAFNLCTKVRLLNLA